MSSCRLIVGKHYLKVVEPNFGPNRSNSKIVHQKTIIYLGIKTLTWAGIGHRSGPGSVLGMRNG